MKLSAAMIGQLIAFIFACGMTYSAIRTQGVIIEQHTIVLQAMEIRLDASEVNQSSNQVEHKYIIKQLDGIDAKLDPIIEIAIRGNSHMANIKLHEED